MTNEHLLQHSLEMYGYKQQKITSSINGMFLCNILSPFLKCFVDTDECDPEKSRRTKRHHANSTISLKRDSELLLAQNAVKKE